MKCLVCERWSGSHICRACRESLLSPTLHTRKILGRIPVYSFFRYDEIEPLLLSKHTDIGHYLYSILAEHSFRPFAAAWEYERPVVSLGIDDDPKRSGYSHTALLNRALRSPRITPLYGRLRARSSYKYAGRSVEERLLHPRDFFYKPFSQEEVILVDDIVTTGITLTEAAETLHANGKQVVCCLTLSDADRK